MADHRASDGRFVTVEPTRAPRLPPRWFVRAAWVIHRAIYSGTGGRLGLRSPTADRWGMMRLRTVGRRTGEERTAILGYFEDGPDLVTMAMNGWAGPEPAWWLNLQARPDATADLADGSRAVHARAADKDERPRLWARWAVYDRDLDAYAAMRSRKTQVVILEPRPALQAGSRHLGPVEHAIRVTFTVPVTLRTLGQGKPFVLSMIDDDGIVLLLGDGRRPARLTWQCLESVVPFLRASAGWVPAGGKFSVAGEPVTLDRHLKGYLKRDVARWLAVVLRDAGVVEVSEEPPLRLLLAERFGRGGSASGAPARRDWDAARRLRWAAAIIAVAVEVAAFIAWRLVLRHRRGR